MQLCQKKLGDFADAFVCLLGDTKLNPCPLYPNYTKVSANIPRLWHHVSASFRHTSLSHLAILLTDCTSHINGILASWFMSKVEKKNKQKKQNGLLKGCSGEVTLDLMFHFSFVHKKLRRRIKLFTRSLSFTREVYIQDGDHGTQGERQ